MKLSISIEVLWNMAAQEAISVKEIEPEHFLETLLKLSEMPPDALADLVPDATESSCIASEAVEIQKEIARLSIDSTKTRRELRTALGFGSSPHTGDVIHRSPASRDIFDAAAKLSSCAGSDILTAPFLFKAILGSPTPVIAKVLGNAVDQTIAPDAKIPLLAEHGLDMIREARESPTGKLPASPECKALLQAMSQEKGKALLLITPSVEAVGTLVMDAARAIAMREVASELWGRRVFDLRHVRKAGTGVSEDLLQKLFVEAASIPAVVLVLPAIIGDERSLGSKTRLARLKETVKSMPVQCVCQVSPKAYQASIAQDSSWKRIARVIWVRAPVRAEVPWEL